VIASGCPKLHSMIVSKLKQRKISSGGGDDESIPTKIVTIDDDVDGQVFQQILQFIYSHTCDLLTAGKKVFNFQHIQDIIKSTTEAARRLELENLCKALRKFTLVEGVVCLKPSERSFEIPSRRFVRSVHEDLSDIILQSNDSHQFRAHQCVLVARSEYFYSMLFANLWLEVSCLITIIIHYTLYRINVWVD
jgi:hypothetical protein